VCCAPTVCFVSHRHIFTRLLVHGYACDFGYSPIQDSLLLHFLMTASNKACNLPRIHILIKLPHTDRYARALRMYMLLLCTNNTYKYSFGRARARTRQCVWLLSAKQKYANTHTHTHTHTPTPGCVCCCHQQNKKTQPETNICNPTQSR
jgi:hypothetical protein